MTESGILVDLLSARKQELFTTFHQIFLIVSSILTPRCCFPTGTLVYPSILNDDLHVRESRNVE